MLVFLSFDLLRSVVVLNRFAFGFRGISSGNAKYKDTFADVEQMVC